MSKELTPREALKRLLNENLKSNKVAKFYDIIEAALGRLEELEKENHFLTKELKKQDKEMVKITRDLREVGPVVVGGRMSGKTNLIFNTYNRLQELENVIEILKTYIFKDRLFYKLGSEISYVCIQMSGIGYFFGMPTDKAKIIKKVLSGIDGKEEE